MSTSENFPGAPSLNPLHQVAVLIVDYLVTTGVLKDAEALREEGAKRERAKQRKKKATKKAPSKKKRKAKR